MEESGGAGPRLLGLLTEARLSYVRVVFYAGLLVFAFFVVIPIRLTTKNIGGCFLFSDNHTFGPFSNCNYNMAMAVILQFLYAPFRMMVLLLFLLHRIDKQSLLLAESLQLTYTVVDGVATLLVLISACVLSAGIGYTCNGVPNQHLCTDYIINGDETAAHKMRVAEAGAWVSFFLWLLLVVSDVIWLFRQGKQPSCCTKRPKSQSNQNGTHNIAFTSTSADTAAPAASSPTVGKFPPWVQDDPAFHPNQNMDLSPSRHPENAAGYHNPNPSPVLEKSPSWNNGTDTGYLPENSPAPVTVVKSPERFRHNADTYPDNSPSPAKEQGPAWDDDDTDDDNGGYARCNTEGSNPHNASAYSTPHPFPPMDEFASRVHDTATPQPQNPSPTKEKSPTRLHDTAPAYPTNPPSPTKERSPDWSHEKNNTTVPTPTKEKSPSKKNREKSSPKKKPSSKDRNTGASTVSNPEPAAYPVPSRPANVDKPRMRVSKAPLRVSTAPIHVSSSHTRVPAPPATDPSPYETIGNYSSSQPTYAAKRNRDSNC